MKRFLAIITLIFLPMQVYTEHSCDGLNHSFPKIMFVDFLQIYNGKPGLIGSLELADLSKKLIGFYEDLEISPGKAHASYWEKANAFEALWESEKNDFRQRLISTIETVAKKQGAIAVVALKGTGKEIAFCYDDSYNITNEVINTINQEYLQTRDGLK